MEQGGNRTTKKDADKGARGEGEEKARFSDGSIDFDLSDFFSGLETKRTMGQTETMAKLEGFPCVRIHMYTRVCA